MGGDGVGRTTVATLFCVAVATWGCGRSSVLPYGAEGGWGGSGDRPGAHDDDGDDDGAGGSHAQQCREVDFLFVIENSPTMATYQQNVAHNVGVFVDGIQEVVDTIETVHVGVITAEPYRPNVTGCDQLGGLVVRTGDDHTRYECGPYAQGHNYMTARDNLELAFPCAAMVGTQGSDHDAPMAAALAAVSPPLTDPGQCNEGFLGKDALLVLVIVSDSYPNSTELPGDIDPYFAGTSIVERVGGFDDVVVVLISSTEATPCLNPLNPALADFAHLFYNYYEGSICERDYRRVFEPAVEVVKAACPAGREDDED